MVLDKSWHPQLYNSWTDSSRRSPALANRVCAFGHYAVGWTRRIQIQRSRTALRLHQYGPHGTARLHCSRAFHGVFRVCRAHRCGASVRLYTQFRAGPGRGGVALHRGPRLFEDLAAVSGRNSGDKYVLVHSQLHRHHFTDHRHRRRRHGCEERLQPTAMASVHGPYKRASDAGAHNSMTQRSALRPITSGSDPSSEPSSVGSDVPSTQSRARFYRPELDLLRFVAFLAVFLHHAIPPYARMHDGLEHSRAILIFVREIGSYGMSLFFVLSSYLITELLLREKQATGTVHMRAFYTRRILRIWPLYFGFLAFCVVLPHFVRKVAPLETGRVLAFVFLAGNWFTGRAGFTANPASPLWSISL